MKPIKILTDTCGDLTIGMQKEYDITSIEFTIYFMGSEISAEPWKAVKSSDLYDALRNGERVYTLPATENEIRKKFKQFVKEYDIVYISSCDKQSRTISKARKVAAEILENNPDYRIEIVDTLNASFGQGMLAIEAAKMRDDGATVEEIVERITKIRKTVIQFATVDTLKYLSKANKVNARTAALGDLLKLKPLLTSDVEGKQTSIKSVRGKEKSLEGICDLFMENVLNPEEQIITIFHGDDLDTANRVKDLLLQKGLKCKGFHILCVGPVIGIATGPGMVGIFGYGKEVTFLGD